MGQFDKYVIIKLVEMGYVSGREVLRIIELRKNGYAVSIEKLRFLN